MHTFGKGFRRRKGDQTLDVWYPKIGDRSFSIPAQKSNTYFEMDHIDFELKDAKAPIDSVEDAYFRLQMLSQRIVKPNEIGLENLFATLPNIAWTNHGPILATDIETERLKHHDLTITHVDKFPYMINYHVPSGVRIASGSQVRLGAYLGEGTTVMPAGYVNFNAGTLGAAMVEGRISAGVVVGKNSDIGGGASIMGTLSGGNEDIISIGENCLIGANAGTGISLGDGCTIAAGVYVYAGMKIAVYNEKNEKVDTLKAKTLSGRSHLLFLQDSQSGEILCKPNVKTIKLNETLHQTQ